jgi:HAD superfamily hydrolase (TIGR01490 family)
MTSAAPVGHHATTPQAGGAAAFFDVDNTLMRGASLFYLARGLHDRKYLPVTQILRAGWLQLKFRVVGSENPEHIRLVRESALTFIKGWSVAELTELSEEIFDEVLATKVWPGTHALAQQHLDRGEPVWLVTATPVEIAKVIASRLGLTGGLGTVAESENGYYTGRLVGELLHGDRKAEAVHEFAEREGLDLSKCAAYSDSSNDMPLLSMVGMPYAVNPDRRLRAHARANGWRIRDFRRGRRAMRAGLAAAGFAGAIGGAAVVGMALGRAGFRLRRKHRKQRTKGIVNRQ